MNSWPSKMESINSCLRFLQFLKANRWTLFCVLITSLSVINPTWYGLWLWPWAALILVLGYYGINWAKLPITYSAFFYYYLFDAVIRGYVISPQLESNMVLILKGCIIESIVLMGVFLIFLKSKVDLTQSLKVTAILVSFGIVFAPNARIQTIFLDNPSMASTFVVLASGCHWLSFIPIIFTHSWCAAIVLTVSVLFRFRRYWTSLSPFALALIIGTLETGFKIPDNNRFHTWTQYFNLWRTQGWWEISTGLGPGSSPIWLRLIADQAKDKEVYFWVHNEFLQLLIETGVIGLGLALTALIKLFSVAKENEKMMLIAFGTASLINYPTHIAITALIGWSLMANILRGENHGV
jgi:hypothetical protein